MSFNMIAIPLIYNELSSHCSELEKPKKFELPADIQIGLAVQFELPALMNGIYHFAYWFSGREELKNPYRLT